MADLKAGSTVGGNLIWNKGSLPFTPVSPDSVRYKSFKVYTENDPPTAAEVDAVSASQGGSFAKSVNFAMGLTVPRAGASSSGLTIKPGTGDGATWTTYNADLATWWGLVISNPTGDGIAGPTILFNGRQGQITSKGKIQAERGGVWDGQNQVWSKSNVPSNNDLNLVSRGGDTMSGQLTITAGGIELGNATGIWAQTSPVGSGRRLIAQIDGANKVTLGDKVIPTQIWSSTNPTVSVGSAVYTFYHTGNKPNNVDVGLGNVLDARQLRFAGDSNTNGDFTFGTLNLAKEIASNAVGNEAVNAKWIKSWGFSSIGVVAAHDWNTLVTQGSYTVNMATRGPNAPGVVSGSEGVYGYGTLNITGGSGGSDGGRIVQEYVSHEYGANRIRVARRVKNTDAGVANWTPWRYFVSSSEAEGFYVSRSGDTMTGPLTFATSARKAVVWANNSFGSGATADTYSMIQSNENGWALTWRESTLHGNQLYGINPQGRFMFRPVNGPKDPGAPTGDAEVIHAANIKTVLQPLYLPRVDDAPQITLVPAARPSGNAQIWYKLATLPETTTGNTNMQFQVFGATDYGRNKRALETINFSTRNIGTAAITQANVDTYLSHIRMGVQVMRDESSAMARYGLLRNGTTIELWMRSNTYPQDSTRFSLLHNNGGVWLADGAPVVVFSAAPAGIFYATPADVYTTLQPPSKDDVGLGLVENYVAVNKLGDSMGPLTATTVVTNNIKATGSGNLLPSSQGATLSWNRATNSGRSDFINHRGTAAGGFEWWNGDSSSQTSMMILDSSGRLTPNYVTITGRSTDTANNVELLKLSSSLSAAPLTMERRAAGNLSIGFKSTWGGGDTWYFGQRTDGEFGWNTDIDLNPSRAELSANARLAIHNKNLMAQFEPWPANTNLPAATIGEPATNSPWPTGIYFGGTTGTEAGYPGDKYGTLFGFKANENRHAQFYVTSAGNGQPRISFRSLRTAGDEAATKVWHTVYTSTNPPSPSDVNAIPMGTVLDYGTF